MTHSDAWVAGVDGCKAGWIVALRRIDDPGTATLRLCQTFAEVLALPEAPGPIAIDIPIGLAGCATKGGRRADIEARAVLGPRQSSIFAMPARAAIAETDYRDACRVALANSDPPRMISKQAFYLFPKIREVDALMTPELQARVVECHPELAFYGLNGDRPLNEPKKAKSKVHLLGITLRQNLLAAAGYHTDILKVHSFKASHVGIDDRLDALANSWSAARIAIGLGRRFPDRPLFDERGLRMEIWG
jgi:predicted RNase H-like nuclease